MTMKKHLLKTLLVATGLLAGTSPILADGVITTLPVTEDFENGTGIFTGGAINSANSDIGNVLNVYNTTAIAYFDTDSGQEGNQAYTLKSNEKLSIKYTAFHGYMYSKDGSLYSMVSIKNSDGKEILSYKYDTNGCKIIDVSIGGSTVAGFSAFSYQSYNKSNPNGFTGNSRPFAGGTGNNPEIAISISGDGLVTVNFVLTKRKINQTYSGLLDDNISKDIASINISNNVNNEDRGYGIDNLSITSEITADVSAKYTIKRVCGEKILDETESSGIVGNKPNISTDNFYTSDGKKYIYVSNDIETVGNIAENSVYTINYREAATFNYTINCVVGDTKTPIQGSAFEGETVKVGYPYYLLSNSILYKSDKKYSSDGKGYQLSLNLTEDDLTKDISFTETEVNNIVYFSEAEDIEGLTKATNGNTAIRSSNGGSAYAKDGNVEFLKLPAGKYKLTACVCDASGKTANSTWNFFAGEENIYSFNVTTINWQEGTSEEFTLTEDTPILIGKGGSANAGIDFIYIQKVGDVASIGDAQYATYVTSSAVVVPENVKVYTVKANATGIETTEVAAGTVIPANTAVLLNAEAGDYAFAASTEAGAELDNDLKAGTGAAATGVEYCLTQQDGKVGFAKVKEGVEIPAGKAYLVVNGQAASNFFALGGNETAIKNIETEKTTDNAYYTLQGVKVVNPAKGVYIHNGKKVVIK